MDEVFYEAAFMRDFLERNRRIYFSDNGKENGRKKPDDRKIEDVLLQKMFKPKDYRITTQNSFDNSFNIKLLKYCYSGQADGKEEGYKKYAAVIDSLAGQMEAADWMEEVNYGRNKSKLEKLKGMLEDFNCNDLDEKKLAAMMNAKPDLAVLYHCGGKISEQYLLFLECKFESGEDVYYKKDGKNIAQTDVQYWIADFLRQNGYLGDNMKIDISMETEKRARKVEFKRNDSDDKDNAIMIRDLIMLNNEVFA